VRATNHINVRYFTTNVLSFTSHSKRPFYTADALKTNSESAKTERSWCQKYTSPDLKLDLFTRPRIFHSPLLASLIVGRCPNIDDDTLQASLKYLIELHLVCGPHAENLSAVCDVINIQPTLIVTDYYETVPHEESHSQLVQQEFTATVGQDINSQF